MPAVLHPPDGRIKRQQRFALVKSGDMVLLLLPWLMVYARRSNLKRRDAAPEDSEEKEFEQTLSACRQAEEIEASLCTFLAEPRSASNEETWPTLVAKSPSEDHTPVSAAATNAALASTTEVKDGNTPP